MARRAGDRGRSFAPRPARYEPNDRKEPAWTQPSATFSCRRTQKLCSIGQAVIPLRFSALLGSSPLLLLMSCNGVATVPPISPQSQQVLIEDRDPPAGATPLGAIQVVHGQGCSFTGDQGTREGATALLKQAAVARGANFVKVTQVIEPYSGHDCVHREFKMAGLSYRLAGTAVSAPPRASAAAGVPVIAPAPTVATAPTEAPPAATLDCTPPCSPGYACQAGICQALCNPACAPDQICRTDRVCVPAGTSH